MTFLDDYKGLLVWFIFYFSVFTWSYIPIQRSSEVVQKFSETGKRMVTRYGWQTRKRKQKKEKKTASFWLMHPRLFYEGLVWFVLYILISLSSCYAIDMSGETGGSLFISAAILTLVHAACFGTWAVPPFYWDMPFWGCVHLTGATAISAATAILYGLLNLDALWPYLPFLIAQVYMTVGNWIAWVAAGAGSTRDTRIGNPIKAFICYGLQPKSFSVRDSK